LLLLVLRSSNTNPNYTNFPFKSQSPYPYCGGFVGLVGAKFGKIGKVQGLCGRGENGGKIDFLKIVKKVRANG